MILISVCASWGWARTLVIAVQEDLDKMPPIIELKTYVASALATEGIKVQYTAVSFDRGTHLANAGEIDGELIRNKAITKYAPNLKALPFPVAYSKFRVVRRRDIPRFNEKKLSSYTGVVFYSSSYIRQTLESKDLKLIEVARMDQIFLMLATGRADYTILPDVIISSMRDHQPQLIKNLVVSDKIFIQDELYILMNKRNALLFPKIESALKKASRGPWGKYRYLKDLVYKNAN